mgnify:CR=1 FL=1
MSTTGIIRRIDELGRIVIPKEIRRILKIDVNENIENEKGALQKKLKENIELARLSYAALNTTLYNSNKTLAQTLISKRVFTQSEFTAATS